MRTAIMTLSRLLVVALAFVSFAAAAQPADDTRFKGVTLRVATWGGATRDALRDYVASELEKRGAKVEFVIGSPQDNLAKLIAARGQAPFDLYEFLGTMRPEIEGRNLLAKLNYSNLPNARSLPGHNDLMVPTWITEEMIIYNKDKLREAGLAPPQSLSDLRNAKLAGRVMVPDISSGGGIEAVGAFALTAGGDEANVTPGLKLITEIPGVRFWKAGGEVVTQFKSGDIWVAVAHAGWAVRTAQAGVNVATTPARFGSKQGMLKEGYIGVVKGSRNQEAAEFFINTYLSAEAQHQFSLKVGAVPMVAEARARMGESPVLRDLVVLDASRIDNMVKLNPAKIDLSRWNEEWNRTVAR
ncbi:MAG TPA: extracellular solute-binding protein [Casimicrobiaceae bacterium]|nr:extracellular solute-binding protein [Casimicrobiaceae bacterium]